ncbi:hypothetical protein CERZMDRAFT_52039 [Cercospora zeae-maydis SCOH1-5]|uniref:ARS-binding protein 2 n=1 Tax=Cercospora zeae-maydis SCOH1-5 TaxID=717836 RepID=A0A6A6F3Q0_9PEZI|nr:hypothetical protein CERZMDRAFT_52039 [Cercospora zeae-maydis SCOH1-5]
MHSPSPGRDNVFGYRPTDRSLPSTDVTADTLTQTFVDFILYCNPNFPTDVDTTALRSGFEGPPKSDGKEFNTWDLFVLIRKLERKELKTWNQLALDLGVEAPDTSKGQSVQKVQQYTVRLKRWMRAMHIDAFFEYLFGKQHPYFTDLPHPNDPYPTNGRDGVTADEDLAIRALDPSFRPKRGRRRNSDTGTSDTAADSSNKQQTDPYSAVPFSAQPGNQQDPWAIASAVTPQTFAPWSAKPSGPHAASSNLRWQLGHSQTPSTPHPFSAVPTSMSAHIDAAFEQEPRSAVTPSARKRRKHGPAVSSAWPSSNAPGAKPRGRPPASRNVQDGPFGTFPVDLNNTRGTSQPQGSPPVPGARQSTSQPPSPQPSSYEFVPQAGSRPGRLSLQVPPHTGAPVRLATPPALQINGEAKELETRSDSDDPHRGFLARAPSGMQLTTGQSAQAPLGADRPVPGFSFEALKRVLASDLLRADVHGRRQRFSGDEAKRLADSMLDRLNVPRTEANPRDDIARLSAATWLGVGDQATVPFNSAAGHGKRITVTRFRTDHEGYEEIVTDENTTDGIRDIFDVQWHASMGGCVGAFEMKGLSLAGLAAAAEGSIESVHDMMMRKSIEAIHKLDRKGWVDDSMADIARSTARARQVGEENIDWKARCKALEFAANVARGEVERTKKRMFEKIIDAVL